MGPTFTTEIGRMRTQEAIARAEHYRLAQMARKSPEPDGPVVAQRRRSFLSWKRLAGVATATLMLTLVFAGTALAVPTGGGGGGGEYIVQPSTPTPASSTDLTVLIGVVATVLIAAAAATWIAWSEHRSPKLA